MMFGYLRDIIWKNTNMSLRSKIPGKRRTLKCITGNTLQDKIHNGNIRNIYEIQDVTKWVRIRKEHVNRVG